LSISTVNIEHFVPAAQQIHGQEAHYEEKPVALIVM
jgi:hypothetical protein